MGPEGITLAAASEAHFASILALERAAGRSLVVLTEGHALHEAHERGHTIIVALADDRVAGWIWYGRSMDRGAEEIGQIYRVAVAPDARRTGVARALIGHALDDLSSRGCARVRATVEGGDATALALFQDASFIVDAIVVERVL